MELFRKKLKLNIKSCPVQLQMQHFVTLLLGRHAECYDNHGNYALVTVTVQSF